MIEKYIVIVCGGRHYPDRGFVYLALDAVMRRQRIAKEDRLLVVRQGGAKGADAWSMMWSSFRGVDCECFEALWDEGLSAGPVRNRKMLEDDKVRLVVAFPGGKGTGDMCRAAEFRRTPVWYPASQIIEDLPLEVFA